jgi:hypothetical protein
VDTNTLADALRDRIRASGLSISRLAVESKTVHPVVHRFATGGGDITLRTASKIADILGLDFVPRSQGRLFEAIFVRAIEMFDELDRELRKDGVTLQAARVRRYRNTVMLPELSQIWQQLGTEGGAGNAPKDPPDTGTRKDMQEKARPVGKPAGKLPKRRVVRVVPRKGDK